MIKIKIDTGNAAFEGDNRRDEIARILRKIADNIEYGGEPSFINDVNGNMACTIDYTGKDR